MAELNLDKSKTALLMADFATIGIGENPIAQERHTLDRAQEVLNAARGAGIFVCYCISHFRPGLELNPAPVWDYAGLFDTGFLAKITYRGLRTSPSTAIIGS